MEDKTIEKVDFSIEELETNYYECTFDKCNFSDKPIGRVIFEKCTFKECNLSLVKTSNYTLNPAANRLKKAKFSRYGLEGLLTGLGIEVVD